MAKETFYFPHDYEPTSDPKIQALLGEHGGLGYGVFWRIVEMLHSTDAHKLPLKPYVFLAIAKQMLANAEQIESIVNFAISPCELFISDGDFFWSGRVNRNFERRSEISKLRAEAGRKGAIAKQNLAKPGKEKKRKEKKITTPTPSKGIYGSFKNVLLTEDEYQKLVTQFTEAGCKERIETLSVGISSKGYKYKDFYATILSWDRNERQRNGAKPSTTEPDRNLSRGGHPYTADEEEDSDADKAIHS